MHYDCVALWHMSIYCILFEHVAKFNQLAKKHVNSLAISLTKVMKVINYRKPNTKSATSMTIAQAISSCESSYLANYRLYISVHCRLLFVYSLSKNLVSRL